MTLPMLPQDKANHFVYGAVIAAIFSLVFTPYLGFAVALVIAILKELSDKYLKTGTPELMDIVATVSGAIAVVLPLIFK